MENDEEESFTKLVGESSHFLDVLTRIPSLDQISFERESIDTESIDRSQSDEQFEDELLYEGEFSAPITDESLENYSKDGSDYGTDLWSDDDDEKDDRKEPIKETKIGKVVHTEETTFESYHSFQDEVREETVVEEEIEDKDDMTKEFLEDLIDKTVVFSEDRLPERMIRQKIDRRKLISELGRKILDVLLEQNISVFLNRKLVDFFRRKQAMHALSHGQDAIMQDMNKFHEKLLELDQVFAKEDATKQFIKESVAVLEAKIEKESLENESIENDLNLSIRTTFLPDVPIKVEKVEKEVQKQDSEEPEPVTKKKNKPESENRFLKIYTNLISHMTKMREEISIVRTKLIRQQHNYIELLEQSKKTEVLGNGLRMFDYENLNTEVMGLDKKVEERDNELKKMHLRYFVNMHKAAHVNEKMSAMLKTVEFQKKYFTEKKNEMYDLRTNVNEKKIQRGKFLRKKNYLSFKAGLTDKIHLLTDFDRTLEQITLLEERINSLKVEKDSIEKKTRKMIDLMNTD